MKCVLISQQIVISSKRESEEFELMLNKHGYIGIGSLIKNPKIGNQLYHYTDKFNNTFMVSCYPSTSKKEGKYVYKFRLMGNVKDKKYDDLHNLSSISTSFYGDEFERVFYDIKYQSEFAEFTFVKDIRNGVSYEEEQLYLKDFLKSKSFDDKSLSDYHYLIANADKKKNIFSISSLFKEDNFDEVNHRYLLSGLLFNGDSDLTAEYVIKYANRFLNLLNQNDIYNIKSQVS